MPYEDLVRKELRGVWGAWNAPQVNNWGEANDITLSKMLFVQFTSIFFQNLSNILKVH